MRYPDATDLDALAGEHGLRLIVLFGSQAQGTTRPDSDVDVAILPQHPLAPEEHLTLWAELASLFEADIDLSVLLHAKPLLLWKVATTGIPLYERTSCTWAEFQSYASRHFWDTRKFREDLARYVARRVDEQYSD